MKKFFIKDKTGRGETCIRTLEALLTSWEDEIDDYDQPLHEWAEEASVGDEWEDRTTAISCIEE